MKKIIVVIMLVLVVVGVDVSHAELYDIVMRESQARFTMAMMCFVDAYQTARQKEGQYYEINPIWGYGRAMKTHEAIAVGLVTCAVYDVMTRILNDNKHIRNILIHSSLFTQAMNVRENSRYESRELRNRHTMIFYLSIPF